MMKSCIRGERQYCEFQGRERLTVQCGERSLIEEGTFVQSLEGVVIGRGGCSSLGDGEYFDVPGPGTWRSGRE